MLANDLKEYGKRYSVQNLYRMRQISNEFAYDELFSQPAREIPWFTLVEIVHKSKTHEEIRQQHVAQIPWYSLLEIIMKTKTHKEMLYYINEIHKLGCYRN